MKKITKTGYQAEDGSVFDTKFECGLYELLDDDFSIPTDIVDALVEKKSELLELLKEELETKLSDDQWDYLNPEDEVKEGDEYYSESMEYWDKSGRVGRKAGSIHKYRRKKPAYRYLDIGEEIKESDEYYSESLERWINWGGIGYKVDNQNTYRRKL